MNRDVIGNIIEIFWRNVAEHPDAVAIVDATRRTTYADLGRDVLRVAGELERRGIRTGDNVLVFVPMSRELYTLLLALFHIGAVAVFVDAWADRRRLTLATQVVPLRAFVGIPRSHLLRLMSRAIRAIPIKLVARIDAWEGAPASPEPRYVEADSPALVTFTTGSTGAPKGARRTHRFLVAQHRSIVATFGTARGDVDMPLLPIFVLNNLAAGATTVLPPVDPRRVDAFDAAEVVRLMQRESVATSTGSPAFYARLAGHVIARRVALPSLRRIFVGGAPVGPRLAARLVEAFPDAEVTIVYGSTEAEPISMIDARAMLREAESHEGLPVGAPVDAIEVLILPIVEGSIAPTTESGLRERALPPRVTGEICVAGDHVLESYDGDPSTWRGAKIATDGRLWHRTGDGGYRDEEGRLFLMGRVRQSFERGGRRTFVLPVEERLGAIEGVELGTIMLDGDRVVVAIEPKRRADREAIEREARRVAEHSAGPIDAIEIIDAMPRDPRHRSKIDYDALRRRLVRAPSR